MEEKQIIKTVCVHYSHQELQSRVQEETTSMNQNGYTLSSVALSEDKYHYTALLVFTKE